MANREAAEANSNKPLSQAEIKAFATDWYRKLDVHVPWEELAPMMAEQGLEMRLPGEGPISGVDEFRPKYEGEWIQTFFDEVHTITSVNSIWKDNRAVVDVLVNWQARRWRPPAPRSEWLGFDAYQQWEMVRSPSSGKPVILRYVVNELRPMPGSKAL